MSVPSPSSSSSSPSAARPPAVIVDKLRAAGCVFAEEEARLFASAAGSPADLAAMAARRAAGEPVERILGWVEFCGLRVAVDPGVFVPRRRTEFLARRAAALASRKGRERAARGAAAAVAVDLCCGSGAVAAVVAATADHIEVHAADIDPAAAACARRNLAGAGGLVHVGDLYAALPAALRGHVDVLAANAPYVPADEIRLLPAEARLHEPRVSLDGGPDGLAILRRVIAAAPEWLAPGGCLLAETSGRQAQRAAGAAARVGLLPEVAACGELDATIVAAAMPGRRDGPAGETRA